MFSSTEVRMQQMVLANMKIIILCQRHKGILVSLDRKRRKQEKSNSINKVWRFITIITMNNSYLDLVPKICPTTRLDMPIPTICMEVARPMAVPRVA